MIIQQIAEKVKGELSGYDLAGYIEVCAPVYKRTLNCLMASKGQLLVVSEFVLYYYSLDVQLDEITKILGIDKDLVMDAWWDLIHHDFIDFRTKRITDIGYKYLEERKLEKVDQISVPVCIDGLIGKITMDNPQLMRNKNVRENGLRALHPVITDINENNIEFQQVKYVISSYKKVDEDYYEGDLLDVSKVEGNKTFYKRLFVVFYSNNDGHTRIAVYEGSEREDKYEQALISLEKSGHCLIKPIPDLYPSVNIITNLGLVDDALGPGGVFDQWLELIGRAKSKILISLPMIELCSPDDTLINLLNNALAKGILVTVINSGREFASAYQKEQYSKLFKINKLQLIHKPLFWQKFIIVDDQQGILSDYQKHSVYLDQTQVGYVEIGYLLDKAAIEHIQVSLVNPEIECLKALIPKKIDKRWLESKMENITMLVNTLDDELKVHNGI